MRTHLPIAECALAFSLLAVLMLTACGIFEPDDGFGGWDCPEADTLVIDSHAIWGPWNGPVMLELDVVVRPSARLEIRPGTEVRFIEDTVVVCDPAGNLLRAPNMRIKGDFVCHGRPDSLIVFVGSQYWGPGGEVSISSTESRESEVSLRWSEGLGSLRLSGGRPRVAHCSSEYIDVNECSSVIVDSSAVGGLSVFRGGPGVLRGNTFTDGVYTFSDSLIIEGNVFSSPAGAGLNSCHDSHSLVVGNSFEGCETGLRIFSGSPEFHGNNFSGNQRNLVIQPEYTNVESDTIDARDNWWGTVDSLEIAQSIHYVPNGGAYSGKVIVWQPYALEPFDLATGEWEQYGLHPN